MKILLELFLTFAKIGMFTFGGGYAMISIVEDSCVEKKKWITHDEMMNLTVIAESTPGPIAINCATYVGYKKAGFLGALVSTFAMVLPSFIIIYVISMFLDSFLQIMLVADAFKGIKVGVGILILNAAFGMIKKMDKKTLPVTITVLSCIAMLVINFFSVNFSTVALMLIAGALSLIAYIIKNASEKKGGRAL